MRSSRYLSMFPCCDVDRRAFLKVGGAVGAGLLLGSPVAWAEEQSEEAAPGKPRTNIDEALAVPRQAGSLPGPFPGRVVEVHDPEAMTEERVDPDLIRAMFRRGIEGLTGEDLHAAFPLFFSPDDVVGIKVNPVGAGLISTRLELVDAVIEWLIAGGLPRANIVIWDRFDYMLTDADFTPERFPGVGIEGLQTMDEAAFAEGADQSGWLAEDGRHISEDNFDQEVVYWADIAGPDDQNYIHQHVFNDKRSPFGKLLTQKLSKIINLPVLKNTGNGISVATKNLGYGAICNTGRLHQPLFFDVCAEVLAFPVIRDKLVLNIADGLRAQYDGGPMASASHTWLCNRLFFATDPIALDRTCHDLLVEKRKAMEVKVNEHPKFTDYLRYAERLKLGVADPQRIELIQA